MQVNWLTLHTMTDRNCAAVLLTVLLLPLLLMPDALCCYCGCYAESQLPGAAACTPAVWCLLVGACMPLVLLSLFEACSCH